MVGWSIARSTRSGTLVGPGICRKWRPARCVPMRSLRYSNCSAPDERSLDRRVKFARAGRIRARDAAAHASWTARCCSTRAAAAATRPTPRSTRSSRSAWSCRAPRTTSRAALAIARERRRADPAARRRHLAVRPDGRRGAGHRPQQVPDQRRRVRRGRADASRSSRASCSITLNAWLKPHGLWFPVDVSTSAQARSAAWPATTPAARARSRYGNMVHNVLAIDAILADGSAARFGPMRPRTCAPARARDSSTRLRGARRSASATRSSALCPKVLRRVGGYNLDIFIRRASGPTRRRQRQPGAPAGRQRRHARLHASACTLKLAPLPAHKALGVVNFPTLLHGDGAARSTSSSSSPTAVELVDRTMIELARANPAFRPVDRARADRRARGDPAGRVRRRRRATRSCASSQQLVELMGDLGLPGSVVEMPDAGAQKALWEVRKAGLNIMM